MTAPLRFPSPVGGFVANFSSSSGVTGRGTEIATVDTVPRRMAPLGLLDCLRAIGKFTKILTVVRRRQKGTGACVDFIVTIHLAIMVEIIVSHSPYPFVGRFLKMAGTYAYLELV